MTGYYLLPVIQLKEKIRNNKKSTIMKTTNNKLLHFLNKQKYYLTLILIIAILLIWNNSKIRSLEKKSEKEKLEIVDNYKMKLDSLNAANMQLLAKTFSWAIRSELIRGNKDQINQLFNEFIKTPGIIKLQLINPAKSVIEISTNKKDEGVRSVDYVNIKGQETISGLSDLKIVTPISGLNNQIGVFILEVNKFK